MSPTEAETERRGPPPRFLAALVELAALRADILLSRGAGRVRADFQGPASNAGAIREVLKRPECRGEPWITGLVIVTESLQPNLSVFNLPEGEVLLLNLHDNFIGSLPESGSGAAQSLRLLDAAILHLSPFPQNDVVCAVLDMRRSRLRRHIAQTRGSAYGVEVEAEIQRLLGSLCSGGMA